MMLKRIYFIIAELHTDGQKINKTVISNLVEMNSRIVEKELAKGVLCKWAIEDGMIK